MKIGIDARLFSESGIGRYVRNLTAALSRIDGRNEYTVYMLSKDAVNFSVDNPRCFRVKTLDYKWHSLKEQLFLPGIIDSDNLDLMHYPYFSMPVFSRTPYVLTVHDLIIDHFATGKASTLPYFLYSLKRIGYHQVMKRGIENAWKIIAISGTTAAEITDHYRVEPRKIVTVYNGLEDSFTDGKNIPVPSGLSGSEYILYVGNAYPHKNLNRLLQAFSMVNSKHRNLKLVLAGKEDYFYWGLKESAADYGLAGRVIFFGPAETPELIGLYRHARCLVFPSLMEGFGFPNFEAVACGCLPVVSDIPVFRELWGDALVYFRPDDTADMAEKIQYTLSLSGAECSRRIRRLKKMIALFTWKKNASQVLSLYESIPSAKRS